MFDQSALRSMQVGLMNIHIISPRLTYGRLCMPKIDSVIYNYKMILSDVFITKIVLIGDHKLWRPKHLRNGAKCSYSRSDFRN